MADPTNPGKQLLAAEFAIAVDAHPHAWGQERQGVPQHGLRVGQATLAPVIERDPGQRDRPAAEANADDQDVVVVVDAHAIDADRHALTFEARQRPPHHGMGLSRLGDAVVNKEPHIDSS